MHIQHRGHARSVSSKSLDSLTGSFPFRLQCPSVASSQHIYPRNHILPSRSIAMERSPLAPNPAMERYWRPEIEKYGRVKACLRRPAAILAFLSPRCIILEFLDSPQMARAQTVAQLLRQQLLLRRRRDQLEAFDLGAGLDRRPMSNAGTAQRVSFTSPLPSTLKPKGGDRKSSGHTMHFPPLPGVSRCARFAPSAPSPTLSAPHADMSP